MWVSYSSSNFSFNLVILTFSLVIVNASMLDCNVSNVMILILSVLTIKGAAVIKPACMAMIVCERVNGNIIASVLEELSLA